MANDLGPWADAPNPRRKKPGVSWYEFLVVGQWFREKLANGTDPNVGLVELKNRARAMESQMVHWEEWDAAQKEAPSFVEGEHIAQKSETWVGNWAQGPGMHQQLLVVGGGPSTATANTATAPTATANVDTDEPSPRVRYQQQETLDPLTAIGAALTKVRSSMAAPPGLDDPGMSWYDFLEVGRTLRAMAIREGKDLKTLNSWGDWVGEWDEGENQGEGADAGQDALPPVSPDLRKTWTRAWRWQRRVGRGRRGRRGRENESGDGRGNGEDGDGEKNSDPMSDEDSIFGEADRQWAEFEHDLETMTAEEWEAKMEGLASAMAPDEE